MMLTVFFGGIIALVTAVVLAIVVPDRLLYISAALMITGLIMVGVVIGSVVIGLQSLGVHL